MCQNSHLLQCWIIDQEFALGLCLAAHQITLDKHQLYVSYIFVQRRTSYSIVQYITQIGKIEIAFKHRAYRYPHQQHHQALPLQTHYIPPAKESQALCYHSAAPYCFASGLEYQYFRLIEYLCL